MDTPKKLDSLKVDRQLIYLLGKKGYLDEASSRELFLKTGIYPQKKEWLWALHLLTLSLGAVFMLCGVIFFFAYNWADIPKFTKFTLIQVGMGAITGMLLLSRRNHLLFKIGLTALSVLVGAVFIVFGQIYQTGANAYDFFLWWTLLISAWVLISNFPPLWLMYWVLINTSVILYTGQVLDQWYNPYMYVVLFWLNFLAVGAWEFIKLRQEDFLKAPWFPRVLTLAALYFISTVTLWGIVENFQQIGHWVAAGCYIIGLGTGLYVYRVLIKDIFSLAAIYLSGVVVLTVLTFRGFAELNFTGALFIAGLVSITSTILLLRHLIRLGQE